MINEISAGNVNNVHITVAEAADKDEEGNYVCTYGIPEMTKNMESGLYMFQGNNRDIPAIVLNCGSGDVIMAAMPEDTDMGFAISTEVDLENHTVTFKGGYLNVDNEY